MIYIAQLFSLEGMHIHDIMFFSSKKIYPTLPVSSARCQFWISLLVFSFFFDLMRRSHGWKRSLAVGHGPIQNTPQATSQHSESNMTSCP